MKLGGAQQSESQLPNGFPMYKVNQQIINEDDIFREMQYHSAETREQAMGQAIEALIIAELFKQRAQALGIAIDAKEVFVDQVIEREVNYPQASEVNCRQYYARNQEKFCGAPLMEVRHILLAAALDNARARSEANTLAKAIIRHLKNAPHDFAQLAREHSRCPSAEIGGNLGQISAGQTVAEFERQLFHCQPGLVETPLESRYGVHIIFINRKIEAPQLPYEQVAGKIADYLNAKVRNTAIAQYIATLIDKANIEGYEFDTQNRQFHH